MEAITSLRVAVLMERQRQPNQWEAWRFRIDDVVIDEGGFGNVPRVLRDDGRSLLQLHPGFEVALHRDEAEGYYLNLSSGAPVWFVMCASTMSIRRAPGPNWSRCRTTSPEDCSTPRNASTTCR